MGTFLGWYVILGIVITLAVVIDDRDSRDSDYISLTELAWVLPVIAIGWPIVPALLIRDYLQEKSKEKEITNHGNSNGYRNRGNTDRSDWIGVVDSDIRFL